MEAWGGYTTSKMDHETLMKARMPTELTVTIYVKWVDSMKHAKLDINDTTLVFEYPEIYYLDLNLKYKVDKDAGSAKFDKKKKTLTIRCPIIALTEDSQKVMDDHYQKFVLEQEQRLQNLEVQGQAIDDTKEETVETTQAETTESE
jgi:NACalpha-BTF3-like transcription factor